MTVRTYILAVEFSVNDGPQRPNEQAMTELRTQAVMALGEAFKPKGSLWTTRMELLEKK